MHLPASLKPTHQMRFGAMGSFQGNMVNTTPSELRMTDGKLPSGCFVKSPVKFWFTAKMSILRCPTELKGWWCGCRKKDLQESQVLQAAQWPGASRLHYAEEPHRTLTTSVGASSAASQPRPRIATHFNRSAGHKAPGVTPIPPCLIPLTDGFPSQGRRCGVSLPP